MLEEELSIITAVTESYVVVAVCLGVFINKEKLKFHQKIAALAVICAGLLLALTI